MVNLSKVVGDLVGAQKSINAQLSQRIDSVESSLNKKMDGVQHDLSQKIDNLQYSFSRERKEGGNQRKEKGKSTEKDGYDVNVDDGYDVNVDEDPQKIVIKEEMMKNHMPPPFPQALYSKITQNKPQVRDANFIWDPGKLNQDQIF
ncbi:hypothetical protein CK203_055754 [Vitis vinifera]|uniref:Uncharacterized protein n=1 Tax=Vitis vinifera TaxID=29760 RepID=A0A438H1X8_VITVI|nr:hypothetical protein CK203_055754 [Vitis vinifera]